MPRRRQTTAAICIAIIALAAFVPGVASFDELWFEPTWILLPDETPVLLEDGFTVERERPLRLFSIVSSRGPPLPSLA
jgi:hypothetical protein